MKLTNVAACYPFHLQKKYYSRCKTCSLVTSSGRLLFHQAGEEIDSAECIIRMNNAPVIGYEEYVGKRTTTRIVCFRSVANLRKSMLAGKGHTDEVSKFCIETFYTADTNDVNIIITDHGGSGSLY